MFLLRLYHVGTSGSRSLNTTLTMSHTCSSDWRPTSGSLTLKKRRSTSVAPRRRSLQMILAHKPTLSARRWMILTTQSRIYLYRPPILALTIRRGRSDGKRAAYFYEHDDLLRARRGAARLEGTRATEGGLRYQSVFTYGFYDVNLDVMWPTRVVYRVLKSYHVTMLHDVNHHTTKPYFCVFELVHR